jgi:hypothetical protein
MIQWRRQGGAVHNRVFEWPASEARTKAIAEFENIRKSDKGGGITAIGLYEIGENLWTPRDPREPAVVHS